MHVNKRLLNYSITVLIDWPVKILQLWQNPCLLFVPFKKVGYENAIIPGPVECEYSTIVARCPVPGRYIRWLLILHTRDEKWWRMHVSSSLSFSSRRQRRCRQKHFMSCFLTKSNRPRGLENCAKITGSVLRAQNVSMHVSTKMEYLSPLPKIWRSILLQKWSKTSQERKYWRTGTLAISLYRILKSVHFAKVT